ncbi:unnamed protein product [Zymoseptoria tritici ST99CH_1E4]|uniref:Heterokaryon incompatibility domain-containing protein n=1 Tax=Zymoseptoria tritici ST99CH_1E4 TaxID=1276532 RepID=A0A2H1FNY6_ZYMTR|nr:unnamed protein product [Zymoseptoria tritici ST99CH_1E4]
MECQDPRDRVYGLLALIDWGPDKAAWIFPDYSKSTLDLAREVITKSGKGECRFVQDVLRTLRIDLLIPELIAIVQVRLSLQCPVSLATEISDFNLGSAFSPLVVARLTRGPHEAMLYGLRYMDTDLYTNERDASELFAALRVTALPEYNWYGSDVRKPHKVFTEVGDHAVALVCHDARPDDVIVFSADERAARGGGQQACLVLRPTLHTTFNVVGYGTYCHSKAFFDWSAWREIPDLKADEEIRRDVFQAGLRWSASAADIMIFGLGVSIIDEDDDGRSQRNLGRELLHLTVRPAEGTAILVPPVRPPSLGLDDKQRGVIG